MSFTKSNHEDDSGDFSLKKSEIVYQPNETERKVQSKTFQTPEHMKELEAKKIRYSSSGVDFGRLGAKSQCQL